MACGNCASRQAKQTYEHTAANGTVTVYKTETEARAAKARRGGTYKVQK